MGFTVCSFAQQKQDSASINPGKIAVTDTSKLSKVAVVDTTPFMTPKKIGLLSGIIPGFGQFKNRQYWKIGVIYVGAAAAVYFIHDNQTNYNAARSEYASRLSGKPSTNSERYSGYSLDQLSQEMQYYQKNLDMTYVLTGVGYALQIIDAVVFAHLKGFDISEDISLKWKPVLTPQGGPGFGLVMNF